MLDVGSEHNIRYVGFGLACLDIAADKFKFPGALHPLSDSLKRCDILEQGIRFRVIECEFDNKLLASAQVALGVVALKVLSVFL